MRLGSSPESPFALNQEAWTKYEDSAIFSKEMKIYLATGNINKKKEFSRILKEHTVVIPKDEGIDFDPVEDGFTFYENGIIKAKALYQIVRSPVVADDSGISVDALGGIPGIYSARYGGPLFPKGMPDGSKIPQSEQNRLLIESLNTALDKGEVDTSTFKNGPRSAHYTCSMILYLGNDRLFVVQETMEGTIIESIDKARGEGGFGYDPIFFIPSLALTAAELTADEKNAISHRGKASRLIQKIIDNIL